MVEAKKHSWTQVYGGTWQINPEHMQIDGRGWDATLATIIGRAAEGLGVSGDVTAEFYKTACIR